VAIENSFATRNIRAIILPSLRLYVLINLGEDYINLNHGSYSIITARCIYCI